MPDPPLPTPQSAGAFVLTQTPPESEGEEARLTQTRGTEQGRKGQKMDEGREKWRKTNPGKVSWKPKMRMFLGRRRTKSVSHS